MKKEYRKAAKVYAQSSKTFEEATLRFINEGLFTYLIDYLAEVLAIILRKPPQAQSKQQKLLLCTWIVELKLNEINDILSRAKSDLATLEEREEAQTEWAEKRNQLRSFLTEHKGRVNPETIF